MRVRLLVVAGVLALAFVPKPVFAQDVVQEQCGRLDLFGLCKGAAYDAQARTNEARAAADAAAYEAAQRAAADAAQAQWAAQQAVWEAEQQRLRDAQVAEQARLRDESVAVQQRMVDVAAVEEQGKTERHEATVNGEVAKVREREQTERARLEQEGATERARIDADAAVLIATEQAAANVDAALWSNAGLGFGLGTGLGAGASVVAVVLVWLAWRSRGQEAERALPVAVIPPVPASAERAAERYELVTGGVAAPWYDERAQSYVVLTESGELLDNRWALEGWTPRGYLE